ncbi:UTP--glucose-1-phosphate uridylyltransferase [Rhodovulum iodosum]|uniref:UTP--glucose-1-phosphate uridylyltransferase n=1 Tax=Rhodovulum iodosum TaxID=68291 RepID=A0ABV3XSM9_9RHOB|nr:UTP--glucose-1-phosphate uridylyltransferase [Rhodovulum robiginosum]RSK30526.1 UTP--glucose-1-phosphate uridylyltransferase [Rhodovulum robiginosum]
MTSATVRTAIFPVAGLGTRFLPATKATPKELLPVIDTPLIQYAIDEARDAGVERMVFVSHPSKSAIERHVRADHDLIETLHARGKSHIARELHAAALDEDEHEVEFVMQHEPLGLGHAVLCARPHVLPGPVAVLLPDDLILSGPGCLSEMIAAYQACDAGHMVATMDVTRETVSRYGVLVPKRHDGRLVHASGMVEKPAAEDAPSLKAVVGRYILDGAIFDTLASQPPGANDEIQLTDAIARDAGPLGLAGFAFSGERFDCGSKEGMLRATLSLAAQHPSYRQVLTEFATPATAMAAE